MTSDKAGDKASSKEKGILDQAFQAGINAAESLHKTAFEIPINLLEGMGAPKDKIDMVRDKSDKMIGELYDTITKIAAQLGPVSARESTKPSKKG